MSAPDVEMESAKEEPAAGEGGAAGAGAGGAAGAGEGGAAGAGAGGAAGAGAGGAAGAGEGGAAGAGEGGAADTDADAASAELVPAEQVPFAQLCDVFERIYKKKKDRQEQDNILTSFFDELRINAAQIPGKKNCSLFPIMRLMLPALDRSRGAYNLKEASLGRVLARALALDPAADDARRLAGYRARGNAPEADFAGVAYFVLKNRLPPTPGDLSVKDVNDVLDKIATAQVGDKTPALEAAFGRVLRRLSAEQLKWFLRVVLKDLRLRVGAPRVLAAAHPDAPEYFDSCADLLKTCSELEAGATRPLELGVQLFAAVSPMLAERLDVTRLPRLRAAHYCVEDKFDGERFQLHMRDGVFEYFSRRGHSYGAHFGRGYEAGAGLLTPRLRGAFAADVASLILDGEMMGWHKERQVFGSKGMSFDVKKMTVNSSYQPCFCVFDILYYNGRSLAGEAGAGGAALRERTRLLERVVQGRSGALVRSVRTPVTDNADILSALNSAIAEQQEGIVVKDLDSYYLANRRNAGWYKVKPEYTEGTMVELDLVVIGAERAAGGRGARSFHVACADADAAGPELPPRRWVSVGRVASGLTRAQHERLCALLRPHWVQREAAPPPRELVFNKEKPDLWVLPEHSIILQVRATELIRSTDFGTSHTLRFPRVTAVRDDKPARDAMTLREFDALVEDKGPVVKLSTKAVAADALEAGAGAARRKRSARAPAVPDHLRARPKLDDVQVVSAALRGRELCVLAGDGELSKLDLVRLVEAHGGKHVENVGPNTWCCVSGRGRLGLRGQGAVSARDVDVATAGWLRALPRAPHPAPARPEPRHLLHASRRTRLAHSREYDRFGDPYPHPTDEERLRECFDRMDEEPPLHLTRREMLELDRRLFGDHHPVSFLRDTALHFPTGWCVRAIAARMRGARVVALDDPALTHQVLPARASPGAVSCARAGRGLVVSEEWLDACLRSNQYLSEKPFLF